MKIHFCGAAGTTTGSQHLLEVNGSRILLDCGMYQGRREEAWHINKDFPYFLRRRWMQWFFPTRTSTIPATFPIW